MTAAISAMDARAVCVPLGPGPVPAELVRRAAGWDGLVCLLGAWLDGSALLTSHPLHVLAEDADPIAALDAQPAVAVTAQDRADFVGGGWCGVLAYDGPSRLAFHDHVVRQIDGAWWFEALWSDERDADLRLRLAAWRALLAGPDTTPGWTVGEFSGPAVADHLAAVERAVELIRAGELYQVNVCTRLDAEFNGKAADLFADAAAAVAPARGAYVGGGRASIVSLSPELFLRRRGRDVVTAPIKGTLPRDVEGNAERLRQSAKDAAENVMIVDLMRNDLGRVCEPGTVRVPALLDVQAHPGVWHLVSTVEGRLREDVGDAELLRATFPPGSVTGAPKLRAIDAIAELESRPRHAYTGAIGFASPCWGAEFSVVIRTFEIVDGRAELGVGGGITADSVPMLEWRECLHKAAPLLVAARTSLAAVVRTPDVAATAVQLEGGLLETVLAIDGRALRLPDHLARLDRSCRELYGRGLPNELADRARAALAGPAVAGQPGRVVLRLIARPDLEVEVTATAVGTPPVASDAVVIERPDGSWRHKWADRTVLAELEAAAEPAVPLFVAADGTVLETSRGNVFLIEPDGTLVTAPLRDDLLPGVTRRALLDLARDEGRRTELRPFGLADLSGRAAFWTSSLSGAVPIHRVGGTILPRADALVAEFAGRLLGGETPGR
ncbi:MAG: para-aminobenzoate synthetase / 4-amino-4-deoxychorismate lyase [Pseudonocardiales bacterium]|nr:para-aminobenzoate synthetase / 4-amino-4-deoxychorismate lyase [Pseudonocardiales bacterium]